MLRMTDIAAPINTEPLWTRARASFARAVAAIGDAAAIAMLTALPKKLRRQIIAWLCPLEHVVRKLLLAEAAELHRAHREAAARAAAGPRLVLIPLKGMYMGPPRAENGTAALRAACAAEPRAPTSTRRRQPDLSRPETWRARFSLALPRDPRLVPESRAPRIRPLWGPTPPPPPPPPERKPRVIREEDAPFRLARRFEALRRVLENPKPHAERLAHILARETRRWTQIAQRYWWRPCRTNDYDRDDPTLVRDALGVSLKGQYVFSDSS